MSIYPHLLVFFLIFIFPFWDRIETKRLRTSNDRRVRIRSYQKTISWQLLATLLLFAAIPPRLLFTSPASGGLWNNETAARFVAPVLIGLFIGAALPVVLAHFNERARASQWGRLESIAFFLPRTPIERRWFFLLCFVVGCCEEIIFRGFMIRYLADLPGDFGLLAAVLIAALIFGIDHGYQGWIGILMTGILALVFTLVFFATGSLWVPMLGHVLLDLRILVLLPRQPTRWPFAHSS